VEIDYATSNGTATAGSDYTSASGTLTWTTGQTGNRTFNVPILTDTLDEENETVVLTLSNPQNCSIAGTNPENLTIIDDDATPTVAFTGPFTNPETGTATITVSMTGTSSSTVEIDYATSNGTATAGSDYTSASGTLTWTTGQTGNRTFIVSILDDTVDEPNETVNLTLSNPQNCTISGTNPGTLTIQDDDDPPTVSFLNGPYSNPETGTATITVSITGTSSSTMTVNYASSNGSATAGSDYTATNGILTWTPGQTGNRTFPVGILTDGMDEPDETVNLTLSVPVNCSITGTNPETLTIIDDDGAPSVFFTDTPYTNPETGTATITVALAGTSSSTVSVDYATSNGTATAGSDYTATSGTLTWTPGQTGNRTFPVAILTDGIDEPDETVNLTLSVPVNCSITGTNPETQR
jgi:hypothetical protein